jgi:SAM-dependent methyltransferase
MTESYEPSKYWERRLSNCFDLRGVGHIGYGEAYNEWLYRRKKYVIERCLRQVPLQGHHVLDVGCGTGFFVQWYLDRGAIVHGLDITTTSIDRLTRQFGHNFQVQDISDPSYRPPRLFDVVNMWDVIYHIISETGFQQAFRNIARSLQPGGLLLFTDWFGAPCDSSVADHVRARCLDTYKEVLPGLGFRLVSTIPLYHFLNKPHLPRFDDHLGRLYFLLDCAMRTISSDNISLGLWSYP